jgi:adenylosuccinate lyase
MNNRHLPVLGYTHFQPAQVTTLGKRACIWLQDIVMDYHNLCRILEDLPFRGVKGATGTQDSFLKLFDGDHDKVKELDRRVTEAMGFRHCLKITGQTYTRKIDTGVMNMISGIAQSLHKMATDIRLLAGLKELSEPFEENQIGSSAMAYKQNPMMCERICSLSRHIQGLTNDASMTHSVQWLERTLDDSAGRRLMLESGFILVDYIISKASKVILGLRVWPKMIAKNLQTELSFIATEEILMICTRAGGNRQELHETLRQYSIKMRKEMLMGLENNLIKMIIEDDKFAVARDRMTQILDPMNFVGRAPQQVEEFILEEVNPILKN